MNKKLFYTAGEVAERIAGRLEGDASIPLHRLDFADRVEGGSLTFIGDPVQISLLKKSKADAVIVSEGIDLPVAKGKAVIRVPSVEQGVLKAMELFRPPVPQMHPGIHPNAHVEQSAILGKNVSINAGAYIGHDVKIGERTVVFPNATILDGVEIGSDSVIQSGVCIGERTLIGRHCILQSNVCIGADGFGFVLSEDGGGQEKIPHIGHVEIGNFVELGVSVCVDRAKLGATSIGDGTKIDGLAHVGHNTQIGKHCIIGSSVALAGSITIGDFCFIGSKSGIVDHVRIGSHANIRPFTLAIGNIPENADVSGCPADDHPNTLKKWAFLEKAILRKPKKKSP